MTLFLMILGAFIALIGIGWAIGNATIRKSVLRGLIVAIMGCVVLGGGIYMLNLPQTSEISPTTPPSYTTPITYPIVVYEVTGSAWSVDITLNNSTGGTEQYSNIALPAKFTYPYFHDDFLYISAQNQGGSGWVRVSIYVNDVLYKTSTSSGAYVIASASGLRP